MNSDIRIKIGFIRHHKTTRLQGLLGAEAVLALVELWCYTAQNIPSGDLSGLSNMEIAAAAGWPKELANEFVGALQKCCWLDQNMGLHAWKEHQAYAFHAPLRSKIAKRAAMIRHHPRDVTAQGMPTAYAASKQPADAPDPTPSPDPVLQGQLVGSSILPFEANDLLPPHMPESQKPRIRAGRGRVNGNSSGYSPDFQAFWKEYPVKVAVADAERAYLNAVRLTTPETILAAVKAQKAAPVGSGLNKVKGGDGRGGNPHPATWLNGRRWNDQMPEERELGDF